MLSHTPTHWPCTGRRPSGTAKPLAKDGGDALRVKLVQADSRWPAGWGPANQAAIRRGWRVAAPDIPVANRCARTSAMDQPLNHSQTEVDVQYPGKPHIQNRETCGKKCPLRQGVAAPLMSLAVGYSPYFIGPRGRRGIPCRERKRALAIGAILVPPPCSPNSEHGRFARTARWVARLCKAVHDRSASAWRAGSTWTCGSGFDRRKGGSDGSIRQHHAVSRHA